MGPTFNKHHKKKDQEEYYYFHQSRTKSFWMDNKASGSIQCIKRGIQYCSTLGYPNFSREFILETDATLNGLGPILSQQGKDGEIHVLVYASHSLHLLEISMHNYISAKLKLPALKLDVTEKFWDHLLCLLFQFTWTTFHLPMP